MVSLLILLCGGISFFTPARSQLLKVPLTIGELRYELSIVPTLEGVQSMANRFCSERHAEFNVELDGNIKSNCVIPVAQYLSEAVIAQRERAVDVPAIRVPLKLGDKEFAITFQATEMGAQNMAARFCREQGTSLGLTAAAEIEGCIGRLGAYLRDAVRREVTGASLAPSSSEVATVKVSLKVGTSVFDFTWSPAVRSTRDMAQQFCSTHGPSLNVRIPEDLDSCIANVSEYLQQAAEAEMQGQTGRGVTTTATTATTAVTARVQIDANTFEFSFNPDSASARATAIKFCDTYGDKLGISRDRLETGCVEVVTSVLMKYIQ